MGERWFWVSTPWATFCLNFDDGEPGEVLCTETAPVAGWCVGREAWWLYRYWRDRGALVVPRCDPVG